MIWETNGAHWPEEGFMFCFSTDKIPKTCSITYHLILSKVQSQKTTQTMKWKKYYKTGFSSPPQLLCHLFFFFNNKVCRLASLCICPCIEREMFFVPDIQSVSCKTALLKHRDVQCCLSQLNWAPIFMTWVSQGSVDIKDINMQESASPPCLGSS